MAEIKEAIKAIEAGNYIMFRDKPFIREKNAICYGRMDDKYILFMLILVSYTHLTLPTNREV